MGALNGLSFIFLGGELFMHLEREGIFMEDTATYEIGFLHDYCVLLGL